MLSETMVLWGALQRCGFDLPESHRDVKQPGRAPGYRVILNNDGFPDEVVELSADETASLWTIREGKHNSFPVVKVQQALISVPTDAPLRQQIEGLAKAQNVERIELLHRALDQYPLAVSGVTENSFQRLREKAAELLSAFGNAESDFAALPEMLLRFSGAGISTHDLLSRLATLVVAELKAARLSNTFLAQQLLIGKANKKKPEERARAEVPLVFDVRRQDTR